MNGKSKNSMDPKALNALLELASKKLGTTSNTLRSQLENGSFDKALNNLPQAQRSKLKQALSDPKSAEKAAFDPTGSADL